jgi:signal transduction histidine kinase
VHVYGKDEVLWAKGSSIPGVYIVLSGQLSIRVVRGGTMRRVRTWKAGDVSGRLPYSRMTNPPGDVVADEPLEVLLIPSEYLQEMTRDCYDFTAICVHEMLDRARLFRSEDLQFEKMVSLGRLSAGLSHELNNPSSAITRSTKELEQCRNELVTAALDLGASAFGAAERAAVDALTAATAGTPAEADSPVARADRQDEIDAWLERHKLDASLADRLADSAVTIAALDELARTLTGPSLRVALRYVAADAAARRLTSEIELAASRIHSLVRAVKTFTHMDRAPVAEAVHLADHLQDTLTLLKAKVRNKEIAFTLDIPRDLPDVQAYGGELNQVWLNLLDNAIDAAPPSGHVMVTATRDGSSVVVAVVDDGRGIPDDIKDRIFEPFFTTKPVGEGTGLGLDIAQAVVARHGGTIEVESRPGRTEFRVRLPIVQPTP